MSESLENFTNIVKEDIKEAKTLFFSEAFKEEYLKDRREEKELYHQLLLGRNRNQILAELSWLFTRIHFRQRILKMAL